MGTLVKKLGEPGAKPHISAKESNGQATCFDDTLSSTRHVIPLMELARCLAKHAIKVTFVNAEHIHMQMQNALAIEDDDDIGSKVHLVFITDGLESLEDRKKPGKFSEAIMRVMARKVEELIERFDGSNGDKITCVVADQSLGWALEIAEKKAIKRVAFCLTAQQLHFGTWIQHSKAD